MKKSNIRCDEKTFLLGVKLLESKKYIKIKSIDSIDELNYVKETLVKFEETKLAEDLNVISILRKIRFKYLEVSPYYCYISKSKIYLVPDKSIRLRY